MFVKSTSIKQESNQTERLANAQTKSEADKVVQIVAGSVEFFRLEHTQKSCWADRGRTSVQNNVFIW